MIFITKKQFETEVCKRIEIAMSEEYKRNQLNRIENELFELRNRIDSLEHREGKGRATYCEDREESVAAR